MTDQEQLDQFFGQLFANFDKYVADGMTEEQAAAETIAVRVNDD